MAHSRIFPPSCLTVSRSRVLPVVSAETTFLTAVVSVSISLSITDCPFESAIMLPVMMILAERTFPIFRAVTGSASDELLSLSSSRSFSSSSLSTICTPSPACRTWVSIFTRLSRSLVAPVPEGLTSMITMVSGPVFGASPALVRSKLPCLYDAASDATSSSMRLRDFSSLAGAGA